MILCSRSPATAEANTRLISSRNLTFNLFVFAGIKKVININTSPRPERIYSPFISA